MYVLTFIFPCHVLRARAGTAPANQSLPKEKQRWLRFGSEAVLLLAGWGLEHTEVEMKVRASDKRILGFALMLRET